MYEKESGERNFGYNFDSLKSRLNHEMEEKGIVAWDCLPLPIAEIPPPQALDMEEAVEELGCRGTAVATVEPAEAGNGGTRCRYNPLLLLSPLPRHEAAEA